jgi:hypothetical protein
MRKKQNNQISVNEDVLENINDLTLKIINESKSLQLDADTVSLYVINKFDDLVKSEYQLINEITQNRLTDETEIEFYDDRLQTTELITFGELKKSGDIRKKKLAIDEEKLRQTTMNRIQIEINNIKELKKSLLNSTIEEQIKLINATHFTSKKQQGLATATNAVKSLSEANKANTESNILSIESFKQVISSDPKLYNVFQTKLEERGLINESPKIKADLILEDASDCIEIRQV